jgi:UDP-4-amino-4,6-dideoxy-N-acetyl-beta-L-altrosamine transaminase
LLVDSTKLRQFLPYSRQTIDEADISAVVDVLNSDYLTTGPQVTAFEAALSQQLGAKALAVANGTAALHLAYLALDIGPGDWVIVPAITFLSTANAVLLCGADVIFSDVDPETGLMGPSELRAVLASNQDKPIKAVTFVHLAGQTEQLSEMHAIARHHNLFIVEDACHAIGTFYTENGNGYPVGACVHSDITVFSFHPVKTIAMGEGGAVTSADEVLLQKIERLRNHGMTRSISQYVSPENAGPGYYEMQSLGLNYRLSDLHCALGLSQLKKLDDFKKRRQGLVARYDSLLLDAIPGLTPLRKTDYSDACWHLYPVLIDFSRFSFGRRALMDFLSAAGVGTQVHYIPVNAQPYYQRRYDQQGVLGAEAYYQATLSLPLYPSLTYKDQDYIIESLNAALLDELNLT